MTDTSRVDSLLKFALAAAAQEEPWHRGLGPIHLIKYAYLGDLAHAERHAGETFTGAPWRFYHFGPWTPDVFERIAPVLSGVRAEEKRFSSPKAEDDAVRWELHDEDAEPLLRRAENELPSEVYSAVKNAVHRFGSDTSTLLEFVYLTLPMLRAAPNETLDFHLEPEPEAEVPQATASAPPRAMSASARKRRDAMLRDMRERFRRRLAEHVASSPQSSPIPPPRYDEAFAEGQRWLEECAGGRVEPEHGTLIFSDAVWKSGARRDRDIS